MMNLIKINSEIEIPSNFNPTSELQIPENFSVILWRGVQSHTGMENYLKFDDSVGYKPLDFECGIPTNNDVVNYISNGGPGLTPKFSCIEYTSNKNTALSHSKNGWLIITAIKVQYLKKCSKTESGWLVKTNAPGKRLGVFQFPNFGKGTKFNAS